MPFTPSNPASLFIVLQEYFFFFFFLQWIFIYSKSLKMMLHIRAKCQFSKTKSLEEKRFQKPLLKQDSACSLKDLLSLWYIDATTTMAAQLPWNPSWGQLYSQLQEGHFARGLLHEKAEEQDSGPAAPLLSCCSTCPLLPMSTVAETLCLEQGSFRVSPGGWAYSSTSSNSCAGSLKMGEGRQPFFYNHAVKPYSPLLPQIDVSLVILALKLRRSEWYAAPRL